MGFWKGYVCKVTDFGLSSFRQTIAAADRRVWRRFGGIDLVLPHLPPEHSGVATQDIVFTAKGDIYALGMIMFQVASGEPPAAWLPHKEVPTAMGSGEARTRFLPLPAPSPQDLSMVYARCVAVNPEARPLPQVLISQFEQLRELPEQLSGYQAMIRRRVGTAPLEPWMLRESQVDEALARTNAGMTRRAFTP